MDMEEERPVRPRMKLLVDATAGRVVYAVASADAAYFLFSLITREVGYVDLMVGCIANLYRSFKVLDGDESHTPPTTGTFDQTVAALDAVRARIAWTYAVTDDLRVALVSGFDEEDEPSLSTLLAMLRSKDIGPLTEVTVELGPSAYWGIWFASQRSNTALTDAFLPKKQRDERGRGSSNSDSSGKSFWCILVVCPLLASALVGLIISCKASMPDWQ